MGREAERSKLTSAIQAIWPAEYGPIAWPNVPFVRPANARWAALSLLTYASSRVSLGEDEYLKRTEGSVQIDLFCPQDLGSALNKMASDWLEDYFEERTFVFNSTDKIEFRTPISHEPTGVQERQEGTDDNWYRTVVDCPFYREEVKRK